MNGSTKGWAGHTPDRLTVSGSSHLIARETQAQVDALRAENARLREVVELSAKYAGHECAGHMTPCTAAELYQQARAALAGVQS